MTIQWYSPNVISPDLQTSSAISAAVQMWPWHIEAIFCHGWLEWGPQDAYEYRENLKNTILQMDMSRLHVIAMIKSAFTNLVCTVIQIYIHQPNEWWSIAFNQTQSCWGFWMMNFPFLCQETHLVSFHGFIGNGWIVKHKKHPVKKLGNVLLEISVYIYMYLINCWAGLFGLCPTCGGCKIEMVVVITTWWLVHMLKTNQMLIRSWLGPGGYLHALLIGKKKHVKTQQPSTNRQTHDGKFGRVPYHLWERVRTWWSNWNLRFCPTRS